MGKTLPPINPALPCCSCALSANDDEPPPDEEEAEELADDTWIVLQAHVLHTASELGRCCSHDGEEALALLRIVQRGV
jgi:hypothetical protein